VPEGRFAGIVANLGPLPSAFAQSRATRTVSPSSCGSPSRPGRHMIPSAIRLASLVGLSSGSSASGRSVAHPSCTGSTLFAPQAFLVGNGRIRDRLDRRLLLLEEPVFEPSVPRYRRDSSFTVRERTARSAGSIAVAPHDRGTIPLPPAPSQKRIGVLPLLRGHMRVVRRRRSSVIVPVMVSGRNREPGWDDWASKSRRSHS
jgi:hypothetical protein